MGIEFDVEQNTCCIDLELESGITREWVLARIGEAVGDLDVTPPLFKDGGTISLDFMHPLRLDEEGDALSLGIVPAANVGDLPASKIASGTLSSARIPNLNASKITAGALNSARLPTVPVEKGGTGATTAQGARTALDVYSTDEVGSLLSWYPFTGLFRNADGTQVFRVVLTDGQARLVAEASESEVPIKLCNPANAGWVVTVDEEKLTENDPIECAISAVEYGAETNELTLEYVNEEFRANIPVSEFEHMNLVEGMHVYVHIPSVGWNVVPDKSGHMNGITVVA